MITAHYQNSAKEYHRFGRFHTVRFRWKSTSILLGALLIIAAIMFFMKQYMAVFVIVISVLYLPFTLLTYAVKINSMIKRSPDFLNTSNDYTFFGDKDYFTLIITQRNRAETHEIPYKQLYRAYETKTNYYLYLTPVNAFIVPKSGINGSKDELTGILSFHLGKGFVSRFKKSMTLNFLNKET